MILYSLTTGRSISVVYMLWEHKGWVRFPAARIRGVVQWQYTRFGCVRSEFDSRHPDLNNYMFIRTKEDFICEHCGFAVKGNGYTNHCPKCLWSKHVDIHPGDREEVCRGMMKPVSIETKGGISSRVVHKCEACGFERPAPILTIDDQDEVQKISQ